MSSSELVYTNFCDLLVHLTEGNRRELAIQICKNALQTQPHFPATLSSLGSVQKQSKLFNEALISYQHALKLHEESTENILRDTLEILSQMQKYEEAIEVCSKLLSRHPKDSKLWHNLGFWLLCTRRYEESVHACQNAIDLKTELLGQAHMNQSHSLLTLGNLKKGFAVHEARLLEQNTSTQRWQGEDISGKTLLVHYDGGFGDSFQFLRYIPYLKKYNCNVALFLQPELNGLFQHLGVSLLQERLPICPYDIHVFMMSLPFCFRTELSNIPPPIEIDCCCRPVKGRIGIVWRAGSGFTKEQEYQKDEKSLPLDQLAPLLKIPGTHYVCLQKVVSAEDAKLLDAYAIQRPLVESFGDTVKILEGCERVICADTSVAHLAASMGIPTWILLPYIGCWRWLIDRTDSPWYPSVKLFRQNKASAWDDPIKEVELELKSHYKRY
jgi:hypothetical protein